MIQSLPSHKPPRIPQRFLRWYCKPALLEDIEGDIEEDFNKRFQKSGARSARLYYWLDVARFFRPFAVRNIFKTQNFNTMFSINTKIALRNMSKHKTYSLINISGLAFGIAACLIISHYVLFELSFDKQFENSDTLYRVHTTHYQKGNDLGTDMFCGFGLGEALRRDIPEFENVSLIHPYYGGAIVSTVVDSVALSPIQEDHLMFVEPTFIEMFSLEFLAGDQSSALDNPKSIVITESMAGKYFGNEKELPVGKTLKVVGRWGDAGDFMVSGVIKDFPDNSHLQFDFLLPMENVLKDNQYAGEESAWGWTNFKLYTQLIPQTTEELVEAKIENLMRTYIAEDLERNSEDQKLSIQPISQLHLQSEADNGGSTMNSVYFMIIIAAFILVIAWINFINLSTAKASERGREVGVKKAMGALRKQLVAQFLVESFWLNFLAVALGVLLAYLLLPRLGLIIGEDFRLDFSQPFMLIMLLVLIFVGPLLAGAYPAFFMSGFDTTRSLKGDQKLISKGRIPLRKVLVVFQFVISTLMIVGTYAVSEQLRFMRVQNTGIDMERILVVKGPRLNRKLSAYEKFRNDTKALPAVEEFTSSRSIPGAGYNWGTEMYKDGEERSTRKGVDVTWVDANFFNTYEIEMISGRDFSNPITEAEDVMIANGVIINEATVRAYDLGSPEEALNQKLVLSGTTIHIRGVMKDHNWRSLHNEISPSLFLYKEANTEYFSIRINLQNATETLGRITDQYQSNFPGNPLDFYFLDDFFDKQYKSDRQFGQIFNGFALFAIVTSCLGLFGLTAFSILQKTKEIGIRKILGAKMSHITYLFSRNYLILIVVANVLAIPIAYYGIDYWLQNFAFTIPVSFKLFIIPLLLLIVISLITIAFQTIKAARTSPVKNLRTE